MNDGAEKDTGVGVHRGLNGLGRFGHFRQGQIGTTRNVFPD